MDTLRHHCWYGFFKAFDLLVNFKENIDGFKVIPSNTVDQTFNICLLEESDLTNDQLLKVSAIKDRFMTLSKVGSNSPLYPCN